MGLRFYLRRFIVRKAIEQNRATSLKQYLILFPEACRNCGCRNLDAAAEL